jgi:hypothetical protein
MNEDGYVLKSRRGLLAAGLAVAVVGTVSVASTIAAGAEQIPAPAAPAQAAPAEDDTSSPPAVLPWGGRPQKVKKGSPGASSRTLRAAGLAAAAADTSGAVVPKARYGPKGRSNRTTCLKAENTPFAPPPEPPDDSVAPKVFFHYAVGSQAAETDGTYANITIGKPALDKTDYHTLAEIAVQSADGQQIVEVGWNVDRVVNGDDDPHLFVYHWVNRETSCYNGCGFVQYSGNIKPGDTLQYGVTKKFGIQYFNGDWWVAFDSEWVGYFPEAIWNKKSVSFNRSGLVQIFGEVAAQTEKPCTDMGNGQPAKEETAARVASVSLLNGPGVEMFVRSTSDYYSVHRASARTFRFGGSGAC